MLTSLIMIYITILGMLFSPPDIFQWNLYPEQNILPRDRRHERLHLAADKPTD